jgi:hypothetical protein
MCGVFLPFSLYFFIAFVQQERCSFTFKLLEIILLDLKVRCIVTMSTHLLLRILNLSKKCHLQKSEGVYNFKPSGRQTGSYNKSN